MELTATSNNVLSTFSELTNDQRIRFGEFLKTFNQLGEISRVLGLNSNSDDW